MNSRLERERSTFRPSEGLCWTSLCGYDSVHDLEAKIKKRHSCGNMQTMRWMITSDTRSE